MYANTCESPIFILDLAVWNSFVSIIINVESFASATPNHRMLIKICNSQRYNFHEGEVRGEYFIFRVYLHLACRVYFILRNLCHRLYLLRCVIWNLFYETLPHHQFKHQLPSVWCRNTKRKKFAWSTFCRRFTVMSRTVSEIFIIFDAVLFFPTVDKTVSTASERATTLNWITCAAA